MLDKGRNFYRRFHDDFITVEELIFKNFSDDEILLMKTDPKFFQLEAKIFKDLDLFKKKKLVDIIKDEENIDIILNGIRKKVEKTNKFPMQRLHGYYEDSMKKELVNKFRVKAKRLNTEMVTDMIDVKQRLILKKNSGVEISSKEEVYAHRKRLMERAFNI